MSACRPALLVAALSGACVLGAGCSHEGPYVWVDQYQAPAQAPDAAYLIGPADLLAVRVLGHEEMSGRVRVRSDGRISLPFLDDLPAAGRSPGELAGQLRAAFKEYVNNPVVTVTVEEPRPSTVSVVGEVMRPGVYPIDPRAGVLQALASAGGLSQFAHDDRIYVLRRLAEDGPPARIRFKYDLLAHAEGRGATFSLQRNDVVVVE